MEPPAGSGLVRLLIGTETYDVPEVTSYEGLINAVRERAVAQEMADFVITDANRTAVTSENFDEVRQRRNAFMVLPSLDSRLGSGVIKQSISYQPHYRTLTDAGKAHFSDVAYAVADLVDNSIQAAQEAFEDDLYVGEKRVEVSVFLSLSRNDPSYLVVWDNGCGMDVDRIQAFATYFLGQEDRGLAPKTDDARGTLSSRISKFGVGAIHAGFYIGSRIKILSRTKDAQDVRSFVLDEDELRNRYETKGSLYIDDIVVGDRSLSWMLTPEEAKCQGLATMLQSKLEEKHYTAVVLTMRDELADEMRRDEGRPLIKKLAHLYHYYANPQSCPVFDINEALTQGALGKRSRIEAQSGGLSDVAQGKQKKRRSGDGDAVSGGDDEGRFGAMRTDAVNLIINIVKGHTKTAFDTVYNLQDQSLDLSVEARYLRKAKSSFKFSFELEDTGGEAQPPTLSQRDVDLEVHLSRRRYKVNGILYYYPYENYEETRPSSLDLDLESDSDVDDGLSQVTAAHLSQSQRMKIEEEIFDVFWQGRLIPETKVTSLPFFPQAKAQWDGRLPRNYMSRLHGTLFFDDWQFPVSTNKLRLLIDLKFAFTDKRLIFNKRQLSDDFLRWLMDCHIRFDKELEFSDKIGVERTENSVQTRFATIRYGHGEASVYRKGDMVRLFVKSQRGKGTKEVFGTVQYFVVNREVVENTFTGDGDIVFRKHPAKIHGDNDVTESLRALQHDKSKVDKATWDAYEESHMKKQPHYVVVLTYDKNECKRRPLQKRFTLESGEKPDFLSVMVGIVDGEGNHIGKKAQTAYKVVQELIGPETFRYESVNPSVESKYHYFQSYWNSKPGDYVLKFSVYEDTKLWTSKEFGYTVLPSVPGNFLLDPPPAKEELAIANSIPLPGFTIKLQDKHENFASAANITVCLQCDELNIFVKGSKGKKGPKSDKFTGEVDDPCAGLTFDDGDWVASVKNLDDPLISSTELGSRPIKVTVKIDELPRDKTETFELTLVAGPPSQMRLIDPAECAKGAPLEVENQALFPELTLAVYDINGNLTAPSRGDNWVVKVAGEGVIDEAFTADSSSGSSAAASKKSAGKERVHKIDSEGKCTLEGLKVDLAWDEDSEVSKSQQDGFLSRSMTVKFFRRGNDNTEPIELDVPLKVKPSTRPAKLVVYQNGAPFMLQEVPVATVLDGLEVRVLDQLGNRVDIDTKTALRHKSAGLKVTWCTKNNVAFPGLPPLVVDKTASKQPKAYQVILTLDPSLSIPPILKDFSFKPTPGPPAAWDLDHLGDGNFVSGVSPAEKLEVIVRDKYNNPTTWDKDTCPVPKVAFDGNNIRTRPAFEEFALTLSARHNRLHFPGNFALIGPAQELTIKIFDDDNVLAPKTVGVQINVGAPHVLEICCPPLGINHFRKDAEISLHTNQQVTDLKLRMLDEGNNVITDFPAGLDIVPSLSDEPGKGGKGASKPRNMAAIKVPRGRSSEEDEEVGVINFPAFTYKSKGLEKRDLCFLLKAGGQPVCTATLTCRTLMINRVNGVRTSWDPTGARNLEEFLDWDEATWPADKLQMPHLIIRLLTEDEKDYLCNPADLTFTCQRDREKDIDFFSIYKPPIVTELMGHPVFHYEPLPGANLKVGRYAFSYEYQETREAIRNALGEGELVLSRQDAFEIIIVPGKATTLEPLRGEIPMGKVATNRSDRTVLEGITMVCKDSLGNLTRVDAPLHITLRPAAETGEVAPEDCPRLQGASGSGKTQRLEIKANTAGEYVCNKVKLVEGAGSQEGSYEVVFSVQGVEDLCVGFTFSTDARRIKEINLVTQKLESLKRKRQTRSEHVLQLEARKRKADEAIKQLHGQIPTGSDVRRLFVADHTQASTETGTQDLHYPSNADIERELNKVLKMLEDMKAATSRSAKMRADWPPRDYSAFDYLGTVVSLGYVKEEKMARMLSNFVGNKLMSTIVFKESKHQKPFADKFRVPSFSLDTQTPFTAHDKHGGKRTRTKQEMDKATLPHPPVRAAGNPRYAVNLIELPEEHEHLRDTLFKSVFGRALVFDTRDNALLYKSQCRQRLQEAGPLMSEDGWRLAASGLLEELSDNADFIFGEMPFTKTRSFRYLERDAELLRKLQGLMEERETAVEEFKQAKQEAAGDAEDREIRELGVTLKELRALSQQEAGGYGDEIEEDDEDDEPGPTRRKKSRR